MVRSGVRRPDVLRFLEQYFPLSNAIRIAAIRLTSGMEQSVVFRGGSPVSWCHGSTKITAGPQWWRGTTPAPAGCLVALGPAKHTLKRTKRSGVRAEMGTGELFSPCFAVASRFLNAARFLHLTHLHLLPGVLACASKCFSG